MCIHPRTLYTCNHTTWSPTPSNPCATQLAYRSRMWTHECDTMYSHPFKTVRVQISCEECRERERKQSEDRKRTESVVGKMRAELGRLREVLERRGSGGKRGDGMGGMRDGKRLFECDDEGSSDSSEEKESFEA